MSCPCFPRKEQYLKLFRLCMQKPDMDLAEEVAFEAEWAEAAVHPGPHCLIQQPDMLLFWWRTFGSQEEVTWDVFWSRFPKDLNRQACCFSHWVSHQAVCMQI